MNLRAAVDWLEEEYEKGHDVRPIIRMLRDITAKHKPLWSAECESCGGVLVGEEVNPYMVHAPEFAGESPRQCKDGKHGFPKRGTERHVPTEIVAMREAIDKAILADSWVGSLLLIHPFATKEEDVE